VQDLVICDPRRNSLIAKESDKDDPIDAEKLAELYRGGYVRAVHHPESVERSCFKERVGLYHDRVRNRVRQANRIISQFARHGVLLTEQGFSDPDERAISLRQLRGHRVTREDLQVLLCGYDAAVQQEDRMRQGLIREAKKEEPIRRFTALPGVKWVRAATFYAYVDTPWRFKSKSALWKYLGIGLERRTSGAGPVRLRVARNANRRLKNMILGAAESAVRNKDGNPFSEQYRRYLDAGLAPKTARRSVARSQAVVLWGMWKSGDVYRPELVGVAVASQETASLS
jgi:transposase